MTERDDRWMQLAAAYEHAAELAGMEYACWWRAMETELLRRGVRGPALYDPPPIRWAQAARTVARAALGTPEP